MNVHIISISSSTNHITTNRFFSIYVFSSMHRKSFFLSFLLRFDYANSRASHSSALHQLRCVRRPVPTSFSRSRINALELSRLAHGNSMLIGASAYLIRRLQSQQQKPRLRPPPLRPYYRRSRLASLVAGAGADNIHDSAVSTVAAKHGTALQYLHRFARVASGPTRRRLRSAAIDRVPFPAVKLSFIGSWEFPVAWGYPFGTVRWQTSTSSLSLTVFKQWLKTYLFKFF